MRNANTLASETAVRFSRAFKEEADINGLANSYLKIKASSLPQTELVILTRIWLKFYVALFDIHDCEKCVQIARTVLDLVSVY
jgi:hypothetical protein